MLRQTCKHLHQTAGERSVWLAVLCDILQVIPLRRVLYALPTMSASELKQKAVLITRLDSLWSLETVRPVRISNHPLGAGICRALIWPGGDFILILVEDGTLQLYRYQDMTVPLVTVPRPDRGSCRHYPNFSDMRGTCNTRGETWFIVVDCYVTPE